MIAGDHDAPILGEACKDGERCRLIESVVRVNIRSMLVRLRISGNLHVGFDPEQLADRHLHIREAWDLFCYSGQLILRDLGNDRDPCRSMIHMDYTVKLAESTCAAEAGVRSILAFEIGMAGKDCNLRALTKPD